MITADRRAEKALLARYTEASVRKIMDEAAKVGAKAAELSMRPDAPIGTAARLSQYYRTHGLGHGTFRKSVRAAKIRNRATIGYVVGPIGSRAFTRHWIERLNPWVERSAGKALAAARSVADSVLGHYADG